jgi:hypothetical protein
MDNDDHLKKTRISSTSIAMIARVAQTLFGVVAITVITIPQQQAEAARCRNGIAVNASKGRCFHP